MLRLRFDMRITQRPQIDKNYTELSRYTCEECQGLTNDAPCLDLPKGYRFYTVHIVRRQRCPPLMLPSGFGGIRQCRNQAMNAKMASDARSYLLCLMSLRQEWEVLIAVVGNDDQTWANYLESPPDV